MISLSLTATFQVDNLAELWNKGICVVKEGVTTTQTSLMAAGKLITAVMLNQEGALLLPGRGGPNTFLYIYSRTFVHNFGRLVQKCVLLLLFPAPLKSALVLKLAD